mmetsp:Transcript_63246/g.150858  ORF Transcript_63246/g.150858 Transcript_63246/m.150858 type:complete len:90 (-) Transcript_63246:65-334(-)
MASADWFGIAVADQVETSKWSDDETSDEEKNSVMEEVDALLHGTVALASCLSTVLWGNRRGQVAPSENLEQEDLSSPSLPCPASKQKRA